MNIFEIINKFYNVEEEFNKIEKLFDIKLFKDFRGYTTLNFIDIANANIFYWKGRQNLLSFNELKKYVFNYTKKIKNKTDCIIIKLEYYINVFNFVMSLKNINYYITDNKKIIILKDNFEILLNHLNYKTMKIEEKEQTLLIPKNPEAIAVAEQAKNVNIANAILKYNHYSLKGNLEEKKNILIAIANEYDTFLHNGLDGFKKEFDMATLLINNCDIRHNNKSGKDKKEYISNLKDEELEKLYDEIYQLILFCILAKDNNIRMKNFTEEIKPLITNNNKKII